VIEGFLTFLNSLKKLMETLTKLSARSLEYYINARRWKADLDFFKVEIVFFNWLISSHFMKFIDAVQQERLQKLQDKLAMIRKEKAQIKDLLNEQLKTLELLAEEPFVISNENLTNSQSQLEYLMTDISREYREVKTYLFKVLIEAKNANYPKK